MTGLAVGLALWAITALVIGGLIEEARRAERVTIDMLTAVDDEEEEES